MPKILVVDDEVDVGELVQSFLEGHGYQVITAASAARAFELVNLEKPDLVFLDVVMPGIDGIQCLKEIKKLQPEAIVIMVSGLHDENVAKEAIRYGAYDYLTKPFDLQYILNDLLPRIFPA
jgi:DNA-binding NtrC family response regulator